MSTPTAKERARLALDKMPDDASLEDVIEQLVVLHKVERGLAQARQGEGLLAQREVEESFRRGWAEAANGETRPISEL